MGLTKSVTIVVLNSLTGIAFCRDRNKRSTYLVISLTVADMLSGEFLHTIFSIMLERCVTSGDKMERIGIYLRCSSSGFLFVR